MEIIRNYTLALLMLLGIVTSSLAAQQVYITTADTSLKTSTAQASSLSASQKCEVPANTLVATTSANIVGVHVQLTLANNIAGCNLESGYFYEPHIEPESNIITIQQNTFLKTSTAQAAQLPVGDKCELSRSLLSSQSVIAEANAGHFFVNLKTAPVGCSFSSGYIYEGHSILGTQAISITVGTLLKISTADSSALAANQKCALPVGTYISTVPVQFAGAGHYKVKLSDVANCGFSEGYVFYQHTHLNEPSAPRVQWEFPMPQGNLGSSWCVCRNVGTSPHIGYDIFKPSGQSAVATQDGTVTDITFSNSCGYIMLMEDDFGTIWRYVHLNNPNVSEGQNVQRGDFLASISQYPNSACGTGPHLHFERRSAGYFADDSSGKSCQNGYRACYWDPIKPWRAGYQAPASANIIASNSKAANVDTIAYNKNNSCKINVSDYPAVEPRMLDRYMQAPSDAIAKVERVQNKDGEMVLQASLHLSNNITNQCADDDCVTTWSLLIQSGADATHLSRVFFDNKVRNYPLERTSQEAYCIESNVSQYWLLYTDKAGNKHKIAGRLD